MNLLIKKSLKMFLILSLVTLPLFVSAQGFGNLVPCGNDDPTECGIEEFITLVANVVEIIIVIGLMISSLVFAYAGFLYITAQGSSEKVGKATKIFTNVAIGLFIAFVAFLVVDLITSSLGLNTSVIPIKLIK